MERIEYAGQPYYWMSEDELTAAQRAIGVAQSYVVPQSVATRLPGMVERFRETLSRLWALRGQVRELATIGYEGDPAFEALTRRYQSRGFVVPVPFVELLQDLGTLAAKLRGPSRLPWILAGAGVLVLWLATRKETP